MRIFLLVLLLLARLLPQVAAQSCSLVEYTIKDGLPPGVYTTSYQDRNGYLWVGSYMNGAARFDGKKWKTFTVKDGLQANKIDLCWQDSLGRIWFDHGQFGMTMIDNNGQTHPFKPSQDRQKEIERSVITSDGHVFFFSNLTRDISEFDPETGQKKTIGIKLPLDTSRHSSNLVIKKSNSLEGAIFMPKRLQGQSFTFLQFTNHGWKLLSDKSPINVGEFANVLDFPLLGNSEKLWYLEDGRWKEVVPPATTLLDGSKSRLTTGVQYVHVDRFSRSIYITWKLENKRYNKPHYLLCEYDASMHLLATCVFATYNLPAQVMKDRVGTYWIASHTAMMRVFPQFENVPVDAPNMLPQTWAVAQANDGKMWFGSYGKGLASFDGMYVHPQPDFLKKYLKYDDGSLVDRRTGDMYFNLEGDPGIGGLLRFDGQTKWQRFSDGTIGTYLAYDKKGQLMRGTFYKGLWILPNGADISDDRAWQKIDESKGLEFNSTIHTALQDRYGRYWIGHTNTGLACFDPKTESIWNWTKKRHTENYGVMSMTEDARGNLWLGTDQGLFFLPLPKDMDPEFDVRTALTRVALDYTGSSLVSVCYLYDKNTLIIGNTTGFFLLDLPAFYEGKTLIYSFVPNTGHIMGSINQNGIWIDWQKRIWLTCLNGVTCFNPTQWIQDTTLVPTIRIDSLESGNLVFKDFTSEITGTHEPAFGRIWFSCDLNSQLFDNVCFRYKFDKDTAWSKLQENSFFEFPNLASGHYVFMVIAERNGIQSTPKVVHFYIPPLWWRNPVFRLVIIGFVIVISVFWRIREIKIADQKLQISSQQLEIEKSKNEMARVNKEKDKLQVQAIVNQLNPHFINNALQWLQVRLEDDDEAVKVVGKLSENISTVFKNSRMKKAFHTLKEELSLTANYLFIQKCRFGDKLTYSITDNTTLSELENISVPLLIIQIHAENAIEHGIRNKKNGVGQVCISIHDDGAYAVIIIEDDGVGRDVAKVEGSHGTQNGTNMLKELEMIYNKQNHFPLEQYYQDNVFVGPDGKQFGTRVVVRMPKNYNFEF